MSDEERSEAEERQRTKWETKVAGMSVEELRANLIREHSDVAGLNRKVSDLQHAAGQTPDAASAKAEAAAERLAIKERVLDEAARREIPLALVRRLHVESVDEIPDALDEMQDVLSGRRAEAARAYDRANGRTVAKPDAAQYGLPSYSQMQRMDARQLEHLGPVLIDKITERELAKGGGR